MKKTAVDLLRNAEEGQYPQAIVLSSAMGKEYGAIIKNALFEEKTDEASLLERLKTAEDTEIRYVLCMWRHEEIDIPSFAFRKMLCAVHSKNSESLLFVMTKDGASVIKVSATMK